MDCPGKHCRRIKRGYVWRRHHPWSIGFVEPVTAFPALHLHHFKIAANREMFIEHSCQFTQRHPVPGGNRKQTHKRSLLRLQHIPRYLSPVDWVWTVANNYLLAEPT